MADLFKLRVRFVDKSGKPLQGPEYRVVFHDKDLMSSSTLGQAGLDGNGVAEAVCAIVDVRGFTHEGKPDVYCTLLHGGQELKKSRVFHDFDPDRKTGVSGVANQTLDLGTITV
ncbi:MAG TPA: hypothetical protein VD997_07300 [Phycisphaerales bacterium]|nr:hypothetical protein [Phycisphaerales bacterium]